MKIRKNGTIKLESNEFRFGNFVIRREPGHMCIFDIGSMVFFRVSRDFIVGKLLEIMYGEAENGGPTRTLENYTAMIYTIASTVPDVDFMKGISVLCGECMSRHADLYGVKKDATEAEDAEAVKEVREMKEFEEEVKRVDGYAEAQPRECD